MLAAICEFGEDDVDAYPLGPVVDLATPDLGFFQLDTYLRYPDGKPLSCTEPDCRDGRDEIT